MITPTQLERLEEKLEVALSSLRFSADVTKPSHDRENARDLAQVVLAQALSQVVAAKQSEQLRPVRPVLKRTLPPKSRRHESDSPVDTQFDM